MLSGPERVALVEVPRGSGRWDQVGIGKEVANKFLRLRDREGRITLERVSPTTREVDRTRQGHLINPDRNHNHRVEFDVGGAYPEEGPPLLVIVEMVPRRYRYVLLLPGADGYEPIARLNRHLPAYGGGNKRSVTTFTELERAWPGCPIVSAI